MGWICSVYSLKTAQCFYAPPPESGGVLCYTLRNFECPSVRPSVRSSVRPSAPTTILVSATPPPTVLGQSFWNFTGVLRMVWRYAYCFFQNPEIIFYHFFPIFNLDIFRALILQICIWSMYLVSATPPTVFGESFWNYTGVLRMVWRYAYCFFQNPEIIFYHFFRIFNLDIFRALILQICIWRMYLVSATPPTVFGESFWNFTGVLRMVWRYAYCFFRIHKLFFITFYAFLCPATRKWRGIMLYPPKFWVSVRPSVCVCPSVRPSAPTTILVSATSPTVLGQSFWNFTGVFRIVWRYAYCFFRILKLFFITFFPFLT